MDDLVYFWLLLAVKALVWALESVTDLLFGWTLTRGSRRDRPAEGEYERSAQVVRVLWKAHPVDLNAHGLENFLYVHEEFRHPRFVAENAHVTLFTVEKDCAVFCVTHKDVDIYDTKKFPFVFYSHYDQVQKLVILPHKHFHRLAEELGDPQVDVSLIHMTARCGSTLLSQMMNRVPGTRSMSEPWAMIRLAERYNRGYFTWPELRKLVQSCVRLHCKVEPGSGVERIVMRMQPMTSHFHVMIDEMFPKFNLIFNTRHPRPSISSLMKVLASVNDSWFARSTLMWNWIVYHICVPFSEKYLSVVRAIPKHLKAFSYEEVFVIVYAGSFANFAENKHLYDKVVLYEDLNADPEKETEEIFKVMNVPMRYKALALEALKSDSQDKRFGERGETVKLGEDVWSKVEDIFERFYLPLRRNMTMEEFREVVKLRK